MDPGDATRAAQRGRRRRQLRPIFRSAYRRKAVRRSGLNISIKRGGTAEGNLSSPYYCGMDGTRGFLFPSGKENVCIAWSIKRSAEGSFAG